MGLAGCRVWRRWKRNMTAARATDTTDTTVLCQFCQLCQCLLKEGVFFRGVDGGLNGKRFSPRAASSSHGCWVWVGMMKSHFGGWALEFCQGMTELIVVQGRSMRLAVCEGSPPIVEPRKEARWHLGGNRPLHGNLPVAAALLSGCRLGVFGVLGFPTSQSPLRQTARLWAAPSAHGVITRWQTGGLSPHPSYVLSQA